MESRLQSAKDSAVVQVVLGVGGVGGVGGALSVSVPPSKRRWLPASDYSRLWEELEVLEGREKEEQEKEKHQFGIREAHAKQ